MESGVKEKRCAGSVQFGEKCAGSVFFSVVPHVLISRVFGSYISSEAVVRTTVILYIY